MSSTLAKTKGAAKAMASSPSKAYGKTKAALASSREYVSIPQNPFRLPFSRNKTQYPIITYTEDLSAEPEPLVLRWLREPIGFDVKFSLFHVVWLIALGSYASGTQTVAGAPVGWKVGQDAFWAYFGWATAYAHGIVSCSIREYSQLGALLWVST